MCWRKMRENWNFSQIIINDSGKETDPNEGGKRDNIHSLEWVKEREWTRQKESSFNGKFAVEKESAVSTNKQNKIKFSEPLSEIHSRNRPFSIFASYPKKYMPAKWWNRVKKSLCTQHRLQSFRAHIYSILHDFMSCVLFMERQLKMCLCMYTTTYV